MKKKALNDNDTKPEALKSLYRSPGKFEYFARIFCATLFEIRRYQLPF
jgi:hypothetical protein